LRRADFEALVRSAEDAADLAAVEAHRAYEDRVGWETARRNYLTADEVRRLLDGENPVRVWREKRGIKQRTLAEAAEVAVSYLAEIEGGKKPGSSGALQRIAGVLEVPLEPLVGAAGTASPGLRPVSCAEAAVAHLVSQARGGASWDGLTTEVRAIVGKWRNVAEQRGAQNQVKAAIEALVLRLSDARKEVSDEPVYRVLGDALDALSDQYHSH
jgi:transcriptional regulator with XRE-family HTH domain